MLGPRRLAGRADLQDEASLRATEYEQIWMLLHDLNERVLELEEVMDHAPPRRQLTLW